jgi:hypothetical protein
MWVALSLFDSQIAPRRIEMLPEGVIAHEELIRGQPLTEGESAAMIAVEALWFGGKKKKAKAMRGALRSLTAQEQRDVL